jgi:hypothetical protein
MEENVPAPNKSFQQENKWRLAPKLHSIHAMAANRYQHKDMAVTEWLYSDM